MRAWSRTLWSAVRDSLWFVPAMCTVAAAALAVVLLAMEEQGLLSSGEPPWWLYQGGADGARTLLSAITGSIVTVTGVVFSVTIVAVQLASSQYTPRVLRNFSSDRGNQVVLGLLFGTFTYALLVLRTIRSPGDSRDPFVPALAVTVAVALLVVSVAALIYFINHVAREIHVTAILDRVTKGTMANVHRLFPEHIGRADDVPRPDPRLPQRDSVTVCARTAGYVQMVDEDRLFDLGNREQVVIEMEPKIGDYVLQGRPLASVWAEGRLSEEATRAIQNAFILGPERTPEQDVEFGMVQISDIAIKALSPSINDPTTAIRCIDRLAEILAELGARKPPEPRRTRDGMVRFVANYTTFERAIKLAFDDIRHFGAPVPSVAQHLLRTIGELVTLLPPARREPLIAQAQAILYTVRESVENPRDRAAAEEAAERLARQIGAPLGDA